MKFVCIDSDGSQVMVTEATILVTLACRMYQHKCGLISLTSPNKEFHGVVQTEFKTVLFVDMQGIEFYGKYLFEGRQKWVRFIIRENVLKHEEIDMQLPIGHVCIMGEKPSRTKIPEPSNN
jgi:hypothetical protein